MERFFNTAGPCNARSHYIVPVLNRTKGISTLIKRAQYFVIHAARQTGKTTLLHHWVDKINSDGDYYALYCSLESVQAFNNPEKGIPEILEKIHSEIKFSFLPKSDVFEKEKKSAFTSSMIINSFREYCAELDKPLILFFDEIDGLEDGTLVTFLRQLREGFVSRERIPFVHSIALVGMRDVRDYKSKIREGRDTLGSKSPFNIIAETLTLGNFSFEEVDDLYEQHTEETGQIFEKTAVEYIYTQSCGQPWLVNAIALEISSKLLNDDFTKPITKQLAQQAIQNIILRRDTHIDSLLDKLKEARVREIIEPIIITTEHSELDFTSDNLQYCKDLGLIKEENKTLKPANPIYAEIIIRELSYNSQYKLQQKIENKWITETGKIEMTDLLKAFQEFWRENSAIWVQKYQYLEAAPHLILQAFLQRIINGGGDILREYAYGRKRIDLCLRFSGNKYPIELKLNYGKKTIPEGLKQLAEYMDGFNEKEGWLMIFDRTEKKSWNEKIYWKTEKYEDKTIHIVGC